MHGLIIPKNYVKNVDTPLIFLAGPILGAPNWQDAAIEYLFSLNKYITIVSPKKEIKENISKYILNTDPNPFSRGRHWERYYLDIASKKGTVLFWLPGEEKHKCEKSYGAMTRLEIGQFMTRYKYDKSTRFVVGTDDKFSEINTIKFDLSLDAPEKKISKTLEETCRQALELTFYTPPKNIE